MRVVHHATVRSLPLDPISSEYNICDRILYSVY